MHKLKNLKNESAKQEEKFEEKNNEWFEKVTGIKPGNKFGQCTFYECLCSGVQDEFADAVKDAVRFCEEKYEKKELANKKVSQVFLADSNGIRIEEKDFTYTDVTRYCGNKDQNWCIGASLNTYLGSSIEYRQMFFHQQAYKRPSNFRKAFGTEKTDEESKKVQQNMIKKLMMYAKDNYHGVCRQGDNGPDCPLTEDTMYVLYDLPNANDKIGKLKVLKPRTGELVEAPQLEGYNAPGYLVNSKLAITDRDKKGNLIDRTDVDRVVVVLRSTNDLDLATWKSYTTQIADALTDPEDLKVIRPHDPEIGKDMYKGKVVHHAELRRLLCEIALQNQYDMEDDGTKARLEGLIKRTSGQMRKVCESVIKKYVPG